MHVLRILLLVITAGVLAFILYQAITRQISRDAFWTVIAIACGFSLNLIYLWFAKPGEPSVAIENSRLSKKCGQKKGPLAGPHVQVEEFTPPSKGEKRRPAHASTQMKQPAYHK
jgi:hypothetical protein